jgi:putative membrane protein
MMGNYGYGGMGWIGMILGLIITIGIVVGLIILVVWIVRRTSGNTTQNSSNVMTSQSAKDIAQARYAKGEISRDEYQQVLSDLGK